MINGDEMLDIIRTRQSDRSYRSKPVEKEKIERITEAGRLAPSACNSQPWKFIIVNDRNLLERLAVAASAKLLGINSFVAQAPLQIVVVREKANITSRLGGTVKDKDYSLIDIGIASENICLQARAEGLGSCMIGWFDEKMVKEILNIPRSKRVELLITIGYPERDPREKRRKPGDEVISLNSY
jgi:nitroreductase